MAESKRDITEFLAESEDIVAELSNNLVKLSEGVSVGKVQPDILNSIFRAAHTLKGISGMFEFTEMATLTHKMEDILDSLRMGKISISNQIMNTLFEAVDVINELLVAKGRGESFGMDKVNALIAKFDAMSGSSLSVMGAPSAELNIDKGMLGVLTEYEEHRLKENIREGNAILLIGAEFSLTVFDDGLIELTDYLKSAGEVIATLPSTATKKESLHFDILFATQKDVAFIEDLLRDRNLVIKVVRSQQFATALETPKVEAAAPVPATKAGVEDTTLRSVSNTVRVDIHKLDGIMNTVGELSQLKAAISKIADKLRLEHGFSGVALDLYKIDKNLEKRLKELQESMIEVRMVPTNQLFDKFTRVIRRLSNETQKEIQLVTAGGDTELDKLIIEDLADPIMHIIRNAIDHGIELPAERERVGKPRTGIISLKAYQKGNHVVIEVEDDGKGMNVETIRKKAVAMRLVEDASSRSLSKEDILEFTFLPGFSTKEEVSEVSGRGVGMNVVKKNLSRLSGTIDIVTEEGKGTRIVLTLPITLAIIPALIIAAGTRRYALPMGGVLEILNVVPADIKTMETREVIYLRERTIPVVRLEQFFYPHASIRSDGGIRGIVVGLAETMLCIIADSILGQRDVVIKSLGKLLRAPGVAGATDLGDIGTLLVVDIAGIITGATKGLTIKKGTVERRKSS